MAGRSLSLVRSLLVLANWLCFIAVFIWTSLVQGRADWWLNLNWTTWLIDLQSTVYLREVAVGSVWILWLLLSLLISVMWIADRLQSAKQHAHTVSEVDQTDQDAMQAASLEEAAAVSPESLEPEVVDEVRQKILKLQESLKQI